jgi:hypothetical protein
MWIIKVLSGFGCMQRKRPRRREELERKSGRADFEENLGKIHMASLPNGLESFESEGRNRTPPAPTSKPARGLHVYNSLSREKQPFVTRDGSKQGTFSGRNRIVMHLLRL